MSMVPTMSHRALGRATLARQHLLERTMSAPIDVIRELVGLQAQNPLDPYLALWSRVEGFDPDAMGALLVTRHLVRMVVMRGTIHLLAADDADPLRRLAQPVLDQEMARHSEFAPLLVGVEVDRVIDWARTALSTPMTTDRLRAQIRERFPDDVAAAAALAYACRCRLPLVQVPPRGVWGRGGTVTLAELGSWSAGATGERTSPRACTIDELIVRYLRAFGPASVADAAAWSRLTGLREVFERIRPSLVVVRDERGRELFDVRDGPRPPEDVAAPVRFLPEYDNLLLSHADRRRFEPVSRVLRAEGPVKGTVLIDGVVGGFWRVEGLRAKPGAWLVVEHGPLPPSGLEDLVSEAERLASFWLDEPSGQAVRLVPLGGEERSNNRS